MFQNDRTRFAHNLRGNSRMLQNGSCNWHSVASAGCALQDQTSRRGWRYRLLILLVSWFPMRGVLLRQNGPVSVCTDGPNGLRTVRLQNRFMPGPLGERNVGWKL